MEAQPEDEDGFFDETQVGAQSPCAGCTMEERLVKGQRCACVLSLIFSNEACPLTDE
jgi:hypothetical protein